MEERFANMQCITLYMHKDSEVIFERRRSEVYAVLTWYGSVGPLASQRFQKINSQRVSSLESENRVFFSKIAFLK